MISTPKFLQLNNLYFLCIFLLSSLNQLLLQTEGASNETDHISLIVIRDQIQGGLSSWNESIHFCQWQGITCSKRHYQRVIALDLSNQSLAGNISPHIGNLSFLRFVDLKNNKFYGKIPQEIGHLFRIQDLILTNNAFRGEIPVSLSQCTDLRTLDLGGNNLSGRIPSQLGVSSNLVFLSLQKNNLIGEIPPSIGNLSSLQALSLTQNSMEGSIPDTFGRLSSLRTLLLGVNRLSGEVPLSIYNISSITLFGSNSNNFTGTLPAEIGITLPNLLVLSVAQNQLSGSIPMSLANASKLRRIDLSDAKFTGQVPSNLGALRNLIRLNLENNNLGTGEANDLNFITSLTNLSKLNGFSLSNNNFGGVLPNSISNLSTQITMLLLGRNQISGVIPEGIGNLVNLIGLGLEDNYFQNSIPSSIGNIQKLQKLYLNSNNLTGFIPSSLSNITQLSLLALSTNILEGSIPSSFGGFQHLQSLHLSENNLTGTIPRHIFGISSLSIVMDLSQNSFTGPLPLEVGNLKNLRKLDLSGNELGGEIPSTLGNNLNMEELYLENNLFVGTIPQSFSALKNLLYMDLSSNNLSGPIPTYLETFQFLQRLNLSFNKFEGEVPIEGIFKNTSLVSVAGNFKLCGGIHELKLPKCQFKDTKKQGRPLAFKLAIALSISLFLVLVSWFFILYFKRKPKEKSSSSLSTQNKHLKVSYKELFQATSGFSPTNIIGSGSFGCVFKGTLKQAEIIVAVKVFNLHRTGASKSFMAECDSLRNIRHRNLVKILTSCSGTDFEGNDFKALVFQFMPNGSLEKWLHRDSDGQDDHSRKLNLHQRLNIAVDVASALIYLHRECHVSIIHRDLKPSNVLLDNDMVAHVSDFGLAKFLPGLMEHSFDNQSASIGMKGTIGYAAPEYGMGGEASIHGDVYSYGIMVLEMFTGKMPTDEMFKDGLNLHNYASKALPDRVLHILDPILLSEEDETVAHTTSNKNPSERSKLLDCVTAMIRIGVSCSVESPAERMQDVIGELQLIRDRYLGTSNQGEVK